MVLSFQQFVDDALFHPRWGYYATGAVRFGLGGHYDTYPLALSPMFGRMVAIWARGVWMRDGSPRTFELCEIGAGNGQLAVDAIVHVLTTAERDPRWRAFARAFRYRIIERSPALVARQRQQLGSLAVHVTWTRADLARGVPRGAPFATSGAIFGNEVLDCFAPQRVVANGDGAPCVTMIEPRERGTVLSRGGLAQAMADPRRRRRVRFRQQLVPIERVAGLSDLVRRHYPEFFTPGTAYPAYFACPQITPFLTSMGRLYRRAEAVLIDYGGLRDFHLRMPEGRRLVAGPPRSDASVYRDPGCDDITVLVDFSMVCGEAKRAGWTVAAYAEQGALARMTRVRFDRQAVDLIVRSRAVGWALSVVGTDPEQAWRRGALGFARRRVPAGDGDRLSDTVRRDIDEFLGRRPTVFRLVRLKRGRATGRARSTRGARTRSR